ncbi:hypothetical protein DRH27_04650 [Candidatus Falkowbacteria bacterium]|nr:MAG: hypothetical protein DRH27_04650 [Candidatus Falkowbacteria bacterium]
MKLPLKKLFDKPNCGCDCPNEAPFSCGCENCLDEKGYFVESEKDKRARLLNLTADEIRLWEILLTDKGYFVTDSGCSLPRKLRSEKCLRYICGRQETLRRILNNGI